MTSFPTSAVAIGIGLQYSWLGEAKHAVTGSCPREGGAHTVHLCVPHLALHVYGVYSLL